MRFLRLKVSPESLDTPVAARQHFENHVALMTALGGVLGQKSPHPISLELCAKNGVVSYVIGVDESTEAELSNQLYAALPGSELETPNEWTVFNIPGEFAGASVQFTPPEEYLRHAEFDGTDPLQPILETLSSVPASHRLLVQLLLAPTKIKHSLAAKALISINDGMLGLLRDSLAVPASEEDEDKNEKAESVLFRANLRIAALATTEDEATALVKRAASAYHQMAVPGKTKLRYQIPKHLSPWLKDTLLRKADPAADFVLSAPETANLYHTPVRPRTLPALYSIPSTRLPIPEPLSDQGLLVGYGVYRADQKPVRISPADRLRHTYLIGQTGTGKSTLFQASMLQDMQAGDGCCFIDPHGEVIDWLLPRIPKHRAADVILFDPSDPEALLGLNLLEWKTPHERDLIIQELILLFYKLFDPTHSGIIGPQFEHWLRNAALTITEPKVRGTLVDIPRLFTDQQFQKSVVALTDHWAAKDFWHNQMATTADFHKSEMLNYFTSKFGSFLGNAVMHRILSQPTSAFDMRTLMDRRKILLVNLSKGKLGSLNSQLLGALIVTKIQMAAMSRANVPADQRPPFYVYIDEFQNVVTDSFAQMLSEIRKYGVGLHLAHQYVDQLPEPIKQAVAGNVGTLMAFRLGHSDANWLAPHFAPLTPDDLTNIPPYHYHLRTLSNGQLTSPFTVKSPQVHIQPQPALELALRQRVRNYVASTQHT